MLQMFQLNKVEFAFIYEFILLYYVSLHGESLVQNK